MNMMNETSSVQRKAFICATMGCVGGLIIGLVTEYFTSHSFIPTRELASACKFGTAVNIIQGLALGYKSCIIPVFVLSSAAGISVEVEESMFWDSF